MTALASSEATTPALPGSPHVKASKAPADLGTFEIVAARRVRENADNKRTFFGDLDGLAASMAENNIIEPLIVRRVSNARSGEPDLELVAGHRRFRAAIKAGLTHLPVIIREYSDKQVLEIQMVENLQREDLHPLDQAEGFHDLIAKHGYTRDSLAEKVGVSKSTIHARLKLRSLGENARDAFRNGELDESRSLALARVPAKLQAKALKEILQGAYDRGPMTAREAQDWISNHYTIRLSDRACFPLDDATLLPKAGACSACPKRSGNMPDAPPNGRADVCTDPGCFSDKVDATWTQRRKQAPKLGLTVISPSETKTIFQNGQIHWQHTKYALLQTVGAEVGHRPWREVLKKPPPPNAIARTDRGDIVELYEVAALVTAAKAAGVKTAALRTSKPFNNKAWQEQQRKRAAAEKAKREKAADLAKSLGALANGADVGLWSVLAGVIVRARQWDLARAQSVLTRYRAKSAAQLIAKLPKLEPSAARSLIVEVLVLADHDGSDIKALTAYLDPKGTIDAARKKAAAAAVPPGPAKKAAKKPALKKRSR